MLCDGIPSFPMLLSREQARSPFKIRPFARSLPES
jgi:hypothetical protein